MGGALPARTQPGEAAGRAIRSAPWGLGLLIGLPVAGSLILGRTPTPALRRRAQADSAG